MGIAFAVAPAHAETTVGAIPGNFAVSPAGAATYSIPLDLPPGVNGMTPQLGLYYNSRGGNGLLGVGWSLSGLSIISRCPHTIAQDGAVRGVKFDSGDRFCLDGNRLRLKTGTYGASGATYRTEINHFAHITSEGSIDGGPAWFKVETPNGRTLEYGYAGNSAIASDSGAIRVWRLNRIEDPNGNYIDISYTQSGSQGIARPASMTYGGVGKVSVHTIIFAYESRPDTYTRYQAGTALREPHRLKSVTISYGTSDVRRYTLTYETTNSNGAPSRLVSLTECGGSLCLPATTFGWQAPSWVATRGAPPLAGAPQTRDSLYAYPGYFRLTDMNGDGFTDALFVHVYRWYISFGGPNGFGTAIDTDRAASKPEYDTLSRYARTFNYNGDTRADLLQLTDHGWEVLVANDSGSFLATPVAIEFGADSVSAASVRTTDFDGNSRDDLVYADLSGRWHVLPNFDIGFDYDSQHIVFVPSEGVNGSQVPPSLPDGLRDWSRAHGSGSRIDFNGDGRDDTLALQRVRKCLDDGASFAGGGTCFDDWHWLLLVADGDHYSKIATISLQHHHLPPKPLDINGDGLTDLLWMAKPLGDVNQPWTLYLRISHGGGSWDSRDLGIHGIYDYYSSMMVVDLNTDGRSDLAWPDPETGKLQIRYGTGGGFGSVVSSDVSAAHSVGFGDINGDGLVDFIKTDNESSALTVYAHNGDFPGLMTSIVDGLDNIHKIAYDPLTTADYTIGTSANYPERDVQSSLSVVTSYTVNDGAGGTFDREYGYRGAQVNVNGRGFLGFASTTVIDTRDN
ncbi:MAG TPA: FG-GAP-like repeat-containing protein, partial [Gammaproteobacteria bacterium]|nr:FG-GAP-like repeat-containing protein [Gammaproteobacteria bacterium]